MARPLAARACCLAQGEPGPGDLRGSPGAGGSTHFAGMEFGHLAKLDLRFVAYKGTPTAVPDLQTGRLPMYIASAAEFIGREYSYPRDAGRLAVSLPVGCPDAAGERLLYRGIWHGSRCRCPQTHPRPLPNACALRSSTP